MPPSTTEPVRTQLQKVLSSRGFARNERLSGFLRFVVEQELSGRGSELKESSIGVEYFGRQPDYDVRQDSVVRNEAGKLRARLAEYYVDEGAADGLIIELPKGGYKPAFRQIDKATAPVPLPSRSRSRAWVWLTVVLAGCAIAAVLSRQVIQKKASIPIAVLPLINLDRNPDHDYFADGLTGEIIRNLSIIDGLAVRSQTSSFAFKGKPQNVHDVGKQLDAEYILEGSVLLSGRQLRINVQLIRVRDDFPLWAGKYDEELTDVFTIQDEISRGIVNGLRLKLGRGQRRYETSIEAYDLYLRARALQFRRGGSSGYDPSIGLFQEAIAKDASFAPAHAGLAAAHAKRSTFFRYESADELSKMRAAAEKAIQLDPLLAEAHDALGMASARDGQWEQSEKNFRRAIEIDPNRSESHRHFATFLLLPLGRIEESLRQLRTARNADPLSSADRFHLAYALISAGRYNEAAGQCEQRAVDFEGKDFLLGWARLGQGNIHEAIRILETVQRQGVKEGSEVWGVLGNAYARAGRHEDALRLAASMPSRNPINRAIIFAGLGDKDRTFEALDLAAAGGPTRVGRALAFPELALLRGDPRLKALRKRVGLPE